MFVSFRLLDMTFILVALVAMVGCGGLKKEIQSPKGVSSISNCSTVPVAGESGPVAFGATLHRVLLAGCASCHGNSLSAPSQSQFAHSNPATAEPFARRIVDFSNPAQSLIVRKIEGGHNCDATTCAKYSSDLKTQILAWAKKEKGSTIEVCTADQNPVRPPPPPPLPQTEGTFLTAIYTVPQNLSLTQDATARSAVSAPVDIFGPVLLEFQLRRYQAPTPTTPGSYFVKNLKLATSKSNLKVDEVRLIINGVETNYMNFAETKAIIGAKPYQADTPTLPFPVFSIGQQLVGMLTITDTLQFSLFLKVTTEPEFIPVPPPDVTPDPAELTYFVSNVRPVLQARCFNCHTNNTRLRMPNNDNVLLRANVLPYINRGMPNASQLLLKGTGMVEHGGNDALTDPVQIDRILTWIGLIK